MGNLPENQLSKIFGCEIGAKAGNEILSIFQDRRITGSLVDLGIKLDNYDEVSDKPRVKALAWLREQYPVDEQTSAAAWAVAEAQRLELSDPTARGPATASRPQTSVIDDFKRYHTERRKREEEEEKLKPPPEPKALPPAVIERQRKAELRKFCLLCELVNSG